MIVQEEKLNKIIGIDKDSTVNMVIDSSNNKKLMAILSQNLYQDPIGSIVREYVSNALDAQREAGTDTPIKVQLKKENGNFVFKVIDNGVGLSPERIENVFCKYLSSTKEGAANQLGYFGLGSKSGLAYCDSFFVHSRYEGTLYSYIMLKGEEGTEFSLNDINPTTDHNGVTIVINLKNDKDYFTFLQKIQSQLCYFEGVFVEDEYRDFDNDYKIIKTPDWKFSELNQDQYMHLCLDNVYYALDFKALGIEPIKMPIGLNFSLQDGIMPTPSREAFMYTPSTKEMILARIKKVGIYFIDKWNSNTPNINNLDEANSFRNNFGQVCIYKEQTLDDDKEIIIKVDKKLEKICDLTLNTVCLSLFPNLSVENLHNNSQYILQDYKIFAKYEGSYKTKFGYKGKEEFEHLRLSNLYCDNYLLNPGESLSKVQLSYLRWKNKNFNIIRKHSSTKLGKHNRTGYYSPDTYKGLLKLDKHSKEAWRGLIKEYQGFVKTYTDLFLTINDIVPTQDYFDWKESQKKERKKVTINSKEQITYSQIREPERGKSNFIVYNPYCCYLTDLRKESSIKVYIHEKELENDYLVDEINNNRHLFSKCQMCLIALSERNYNKLVKYIDKKTIHNWIKYEDFWKTKNKKIAIYLTQRLLNNAIDLMDDTHLNDYTHILDKKFYDRYKKINSYIHDNNAYRIIDTFIIKKIRYYNSNNWLEKDRIKEFINVYTNIHKFDFLNMFNFKYNTEEKVIKSFAFAVYLKLIKQEKQTGMISYPQEYVQGIVDTLLTEPPIIEEIVSEEIEEPEEILEDLPF